MAACSNSAPKRAKPNAPVTVTTVRRAAIPYIVTANGIVTPMQTASVASQVDGLITQVTFQEGQDVTKGQVLFRIDPRPYQAAYQQALAALARDRATASNAQQEVTRYDQLVQQDYVTHEQADQQRATAGAAAATVQSDEAAVQNAKFNLDNTTIRAPISGRTGSLLIRTGNLVHASGSIPLVVINQVSPIQVRFSIPSSELPRIQQYGKKGGLPVMAVPGADTAVSPADTAQGGPPGTEPTSTGSDAPMHRRLHIAGAGTNPSTTGMLSFIDNAVDTTTGTVVLKATFPNTDESLWAGQFVATTLRLFVEQGAIVVPSSAVMSGQQGTYVYVVDSTNTARQRAVTIERAAGNIVVIASGVNAGERVVVDGQSRVVPNSKVSVTTRTRGGNRTRGAGTNDTSTANSNSSKRSDATGSDATGSGATSSGATGSDSAGTASASSGSGHHGHGHHAHAQQGT